MTRRDQRPARKAVAKKSVRSSKRASASGAGGGGKAGLVGVALKFPSALLAFLSLVTFGYTFRVQPLVDLAHSFLAKLPDYPGFGDYGFNAGWIADIRALCQELLDDAAALGGDKADTVPTGQALHGLMGDCKAWRRVVRTILDITPGMHGLGVHVAAGHHVDRLERSMRVLIRLAADKRTLPYGGGPALSQKGKDLLAQLLDARGDHQTATGVLSAPERELQAKKGVLVEELKRLGRAARSVAPADALNFSVRHALKSRATRRPQQQPRAPSAASA